MPPPTAGFHHPLVRTARSLHLKKHRHERRCFLIEGPTAVEAALSAPGIDVEQIFVLAGSALEPVAQRAAEGGAATFAVDERTMRSLAQTREPQGMVAVARFFHREIDQLPRIVGPGPCVVAVLHCIGDPGNAGTLIRSAEAFGATAVAFGPLGVDAYNEKVVRASMGSIFHVPLLKYDDWRDLAAAAAASHLTVVGTEAGAPDVRSVTIPPRTALVVGHERHGLAGIPEEGLMLRIGIPQSPRAQSLNAAVAGSIALYEIARASGTLPIPNARTNLA